MGSRPGGKAAPLSIKAPRFEPLGEIVFPLLRRYFRRAHPVVYHCAFGCLRLHSFLASSSCRLNTSGHFVSRHKNLAALPKLIN